MLSLNIAFLAVFPLACIIQLDNGEWQKVYALMYHGNARVFTQSICVMTGAWLGAFPIPLDWNREWQKWPVTIITGAYIGYFLGGLIAWMLSDFTQNKLKIDHQI
ncbi:Glycosylphosphatidylinositol anchor biosynthesis protein 11 [Neolecta irregularis DAH-3]|uniref:Glycosylphosphatidylinositol anchor biosynthesis protein 11 n=1 Tax=Neolecta irregularis (strain DAH-3) TaxID=1198029 RepID=A0A1U7LRZ4_NEOID|nr:Glycosylphosphatidylinositol anchor biosynthesis protein 11 [Neolecta irregularis DAH-3]|eukprot:OLL25399.1 Glycosylphosphatidylinositol anchor biosynthesis protein 11 [Neolecta irregularis DAH-3]